MRTRQSCLMEMDYSVGHKNNYHWFESDVNDFGFRDIVKTFPHFLLNHFIVINTFDSGAFTWTKEEEEKGFGYINGMAVTTKVEKVTDLPFDNYDEWYVLRRLRDIGPFERFVNYGTFSLIERTYDHENLSMDHNRDFKQLEAELNFLKKLQDKFWSQLRNTEPEKFLSQNGKFIFVTNANKEIEALEKYVRQ